MALPSYVLHPAQVNTSVSSWREHMRCQASSFYALGLNGYGNSINIDHNYYNIDFKFLISHIEEV